MCGMIHIRSGPVSIVHCLQICSNMPDVSECGVSGILLYNIAQIIRTEAVMPIFTAEGHVAVAKLLTSATHC